MKRAFFLFLVGIACAFTTANAAVSDEDFEALRNQINELSQRLEQLAAENAELRSAQSRAATNVTSMQTEVSQMRESTAGAESWPDRITLDGDFRYRYENIDAQGSSSRNRNRIRARTNVKAELSDDLEVGFGLATGGDDPVSTNQTLGGGGSSKGIVLNLAYADWSPMEGMNLLFGKYKNPLTRVGGQPLMWDGDWTPEGLAMTYEREAYFFNAIGSFLESDTRRSNDSFAWGAQFGAERNFGDMTVKGGIGYFSIDAAGKATTFGDPADPGDFFGNTAIEAGGLPCGTTAGVSCVYQNDYRLTEVFAEASFDVGGQPAIVFFDYVRNSDASNNDTGWTLGGRYGSSSGRGKTRFTYYYAEKEADAVLGLLTDSDFGGGGTDNKGHWLQFDVGVTDNWSIGAQYFINETDLASGSNSDYNRLMIDAQWKWK